MVKQLEEETGEKVQYIILPTFGCEKPTLAAPWPVLLPSPLAAAFWPVQQCKPILCGIALCTVDCSCVMRGDRLHLQ